MKIKIGIGVICAALFLLAAVMITRVGGAKITEGTYRVINYEVYPDAYITVTKDALQFYNIDLNAIYQAAQMETYEQMKERGVTMGITDEQLEQISDLNRMFVSNSYALDYDALEDNKSGTFQYVYFCYGEQNLFGFVLEYDALHKTLQINSPVLKLTFEKE